MARMLPFMYHPSMQQHMQQLAANHQAGVAAHTPTSGAAPFLNILSQHPLLAAAAASANHHQSRLLTYLIAIN